jgi:UDP-N-acetylmuramoylalanine--D-glutamate ligase
MIRGVNARRALVIGASRTGVAVVAALIEEGIAVEVVDQSITPELERTKRALSALGVRVQLGVTGPVSLEGFDLVVPSPAVPPSSDVLTRAVDRDLPVLSEVELAYRLTDLPIVGITGTNGKTTTTALLGHILSMAGRPNMVCGNIGYPWKTLVEAARQAPEDSTLVAELSSFQLEYTTTFRPRVAVLLNLTPDHLDWHGGFVRYAEAKLKVFANQLPEDFAVVNFDDPIVRKAIPRLKARVIPISHHVQLEGGVFVYEGAIMTDFGGIAERLCGVDELLVRGHHNTDNAMAAAAAALALGVGPRDISSALKSFRAPEHRLEEIETSDGRLWVNDSKATNPDAAAVALTAYDFPIVLLGGKNKGADFGALAASVASRAKGAILFGKAGPELEAAFKRGGHSASRVATLKEAVELARKISSPGDVILLSPACASFDEFKDYEERGRAFKAWARQEDWPQ